jgi:uncharacterized protein YrrD
MLKGQSIIGKKVLSRLDGQRIDSVRDIVISRDHSRIVALILDEGSLFSPATAVAIENVVSFGKDAVVITDSKTVTRVEHFPAVKEIMDDRDSLVGKQVFTESGDQMGKIEDVYFEESTGAITALEVVGKIVPNTRNAAAQLMVSDVVSIGPDAVIINLAAVPKLEAQVTGGTTTPVEQESAPPPTSLPTTDDSTSAVPLSSASPDPTLDPLMPQSSDAQPFLPPRPSTAPLSPVPEHADELALEEAMGADDLPQGLGRMPDPTSGDRG